MNVDKVKASYGFGGEFDVHKSEVEMEIMNLCIIKCFWNRYCDFAEGLVRAGYQIISSGGTHAVLQADIPVIKI